MRKTKFNVGDSIYAVEQGDYMYFEHEEDCPVCNGSWEVEINGYRFDCPYCATDNVNRFSTYPLKIVGIYQTPSSTKYELSFSDPDLENIFIGEHLCFATLEEAKTVCKRRNSEILKKCKVEV